MNKTLLSKDQIQKVGLTIVGFIILLYVYFTFFLGPLARSRNSMLASIKDKQSKLSSSKDELAKASNLERQAKSATARFDQLKRLNPEGAPIAWFPPRMKVFFANEQVDKAVARLENNSGFKQPELSGWLKYSWLIDLPQVDYGRLGKSIADLENAEPLLTITRVSIRTSADQPEFQQVVLGVTNVIEKQ
jgi:hypothetical protein